MPITIQPNLEFRFGGIVRLYGHEGFERLRRARVCVVGIGGVGSWVVESLARSGVGRLTLIDLDDICESNINRQIHALDGAIGASKIETMAHRCRAINPLIEVATEHCFFTARNADALLDSEPPFDFVVDAIDSVPHKCALIAAARAKGMPTIVLGGAGGRMDPTQIRVADLSQTHNDKLLQRVRKLLRSQHGFPRREGQRFKIKAVFSPENTVLPQPCLIDGETQTSHRLDCASGYGAATHVTGAFGFVAAAEVVKSIACKSST